MDGDGFTIVPNVVTPSDLSSIVEKLKSASLRRSRAGMRHLMSNPNVAELAKEPRLIAMASEALGGTAFPFRATLFDKSPDANWLVVWHQDTALPLASRKETAGWGPWSLKDGINYAHAPTHALDQVVALRIHLDDSSAENGPLRVLPGTHRLGVLTDDEVSQVSTERAAVDCIARQGSVLAMRPLLIHSSSKSQSNIPRRVLHIEYASSISIGDGLELAVA